MKPIEIFSKHWFGLPNELTQNYSLKENFELKYNTIAQVAIFNGDNCVAFGNFFEKLLLPTKDEIRYYFHGVNGFIGCGTSAQLWFYFDDKRIIINDHKYIHPYDELMGDYNEFFTRLIQENI